MLGAVGAIIILSALFFISSYKMPGGESVKNTPSLSAPETTLINTTAEPIVTFTNDGFNPTELTVKAGTTVTFINQSDSPMWVASGPHPTHTLYPEFDAKTSVAKGGSYSFTFEKLGSHPYHNHLLLGKYGKIIVE